MIFPIKGGGMYVDEWTATHRGTDIFAPLGTPVLAAESGLGRAAVDPLGGNVFYLKGDSGASYYYAHLDTVFNLQRVTAGQQIGTVGNTGNARNTEPHVHFEMTINGQKVNPFGYLENANVSGSYSITGAVFLGLGAIIYLKVSKRI